ncbi:MAG: hypothetical protein QOE07_440 [Acidimicrobiaceae bacterium]|jgi:uncharacterized protein (DUF1800 family)|nr:hypothetical protein [Acidimicrobiaceae bacterium]
MGSIAERQVGHIWKRLGFGATSADIDHGVSVGPQALIDDLLNRPLTTAADWNFTAATDWVGQGKFLGQQLNLMAGGAGTAGAANPLQERLAWILQGLVVVGIDGTVYFPDLEAHLLRLRSNPFASYKQLLTDETTMVGMMKYLNGYQNSRQHPNQNYGRELMELFTLGISHPKTGAQNYTEGDVREVARSLTGYTLNWTAGTIVFDPNSFDSGQKNFLGQPRGNAGIPEVMNALAGHPSWGYFVPRRLFRELVGLEPDAATLDSLATAWGPSGDVRAVVSAIAHHPAFLSDAAIGAKAKTPIELMTSAAKALAYDLSSVDYTWQLRDLFGQHPFLPPNVAGWPAGSRWLNTAVAMTWCSVLQGFLRASRAATGGVVGKFLASIPAAGAAGAAPAASARLCGITDLSNATSTAISNYVAGGPWNADRAAGTLGLVLLSPEFFVN